ncbi:MAG: sprT domain-containing protein [Bacteroidetes bacterium]|nr:sprT domain-containing protein [Bacteroidota bacterium]
MQLPLFLEPKSASAGVKPAQNIHLTIQDLQPYIPENSLEYILEWFRSNPVKFRVSKTRSSKFGDYRSPLKNIPAKISVNRNLNRYDFLITLVHEMAHHGVWSEANSPKHLFGIHVRKRRPRPHGKEWKSHYQRLMNPLLKESVFPEEVLHPLAKYLEHLHSSSKSNQALVAVLMKYDLPDDSVFIESLPMYAYFSLPSGRRFRKGEKLRKRYRCVCLDNRKIYLFSPIARVIPSRA